MPRPGRHKSPRPPRPESPASSGLRRDDLAVLLALVTVAGLAAALFFSKGTQILMPGPLSSGHGAIEACSTCHTKSGSGKLSWIHGLVAAAPLDDSKACLTCHKMPDTAFNPHGASNEVLRQSTRRLTKIAATSSAPLSARAQNVAFPMQDGVAGNLFCATCHQEHKGVNFKLNAISNEQCRSCHVVQFDSFDGHHPAFENYPFKRRTRIIYDHAAHFEKHFPEMAKKNPAARIPATCSSCHVSGADRRVLALVPFEKTCTSCHLDQITGKERASGPKGVAFLSLPGLDLETLKAKNAPIGEWPEASDAPLTPFMKVLIGRNKRGRALVKAVERLNLQDLSQASVGQIEAVRNLAWEIKGLFHALINGKASDVLGELEAGVANSDSNLLADLTASIPRDVVLSAQQQWLPNLPAEAASHPGPSDPGQEGWSPLITKSSTTEVQPAEEAAPEAAVPVDATADIPATVPEPSIAAPPTADDTKCSDGQTSSAGGEPAEAAGDVDDAVDAELALAGPPSEQAEPGDGRLLLDNGTPRAIKARGDDDGKKEQAESPGGAAATAPAANDKANCVDEPSSAAAAGATSVAEAQPTGDAQGTAPADQPSADPGDQSDDLLFPTKEEQAANKIEANDAEVASQADPAASTSSITAPARTSETVATQPQAPAEPASDSGSDVDPESWADYGGWYRQDYAIYYRPTGHMDKFIHAWLTLTGPQAPKGAGTPTTAVFDALTGKDAQGSCTKCHSVDDVRGKGRIVNFLPASVESKMGRFTNFIHEPHFGILDNRGCLTCHDLAKDRPYLKSYEQGDPHKFVSGFGDAKKEVCQTCHSTGLARQDCLLCHKYHVNGVVTPVTDTKNPAQ